MHNRIKEIRKDKKLSQAAFAKAIGISRPAVSLIESGENNPSEQTIRAICREFCVERYWLETGNGDMYIEPYEITISQVESILHGSVEDSRIEAVIQLLQMPPEEFYAWQHALEAFQVYSRWKGAANEEKAEQ